MVKDWLDFVNESLTWAFLGLALIFFVGSPRDLYPPMILGSFFIVTLIIPKIFNVSKIERLAIILLFYPGMLGECFTLCLYNKLFFYDKILHFLFPLVIVLIICSRLQAYGLVKYIPFFAVLIVLGVGGLVEIYEYAYDGMLHNGMQGVFDKNFHALIGGLDDTMWDMICNLAGSIVGVVIYYYKKRVVDE